MTNETSDKSRTHIETAKAKKAVDRRTMMGMTAAGLAGSLLASTAVSGAHQASATHLPLQRRFDGKVVLITGATSGIGRAAAVAFAGEGGKVGLCGRREQLGQEVERQIKAAGGEATYVRADVLLENDVKTFVDQIVATYGRLDVAFNNAGITIEKPLHEYSSQEWDSVLNTNLRGVFLAAKFIRDKDHGRLISKERHDDIEMYRTHPRCDDLIFFIYDPDAFIPDQRALREAIEIERAYGRSGKRKLSCHLIVKP